jgi:hypothetical protein
MVCPSCNGKTKANNRCQLKTCKFAPKCHHHTKVVVRRSQVAGKGLFAKSDIKKNEIVGNYTRNTIKMNLAQYKAAYPNNNATHVAYVRNGRSYYDGKDLKKNVCGAANTARGTRFTNNLKLSENGNVSAKKSIAAGNELFMVYGSGYRV